MQTDKALELQMNSQQVVLDPSATTTLTSLASTQIPSAPPSPVSAEDDELDDQNSILLESSFRNNVSCIFHFHVVLYISNWDCGVDNKVASRPGKVREFHEIRKSQGIFTRNWEKSGNFTCVK